MKKISQFALLLVILLSASASSPQKSPAKAMLKVGNSMSGLSFKDQFEQKHQIDKSTQRLIVALDKEPAHAVNEFLADKDPNFLKEHQSLFFVDVSAAPGIIQKLFILPGLKKYDYPVIIFTEEEEAKPFRLKVNTSKILEVSLQNQKITAVKEHNPTVDAVKGMF